MPLHETGKQRASRIPLDYFKSANGLERWKGWLGWLALVAPIIWLGSSLVQSGEADFHASRGPVAGVHQAWETKCSACHVPFQAISSQSFVPPLMASASDEACQACHKGPEHHKNQKSTHSCASCHREHRGPDASLVRGPDGDCTQCHKNLGEHRTDLGGNFAVAITRFDVDHPPFRSLKSDPGKLKFNHERHLARGIIAFRPRYEALQKEISGERITEQTPVQLDCKACHQMDSNESPRGSGAYFRPITYENHCQACHPLGVAEVAANDKLAEVSVPHRLQPKEVMGILRDHFTSRAAQGQTGLLDKKASIPLPGKLPTTLLEPKTPELIDRNVASAEKQLFLGGMKRNCVLCHEFEFKKGERTIVPADVPHVWFQHARFDHRAHRATSCKECHPGAQSSITNADVLVPDRDNCVKCHASRTIVAGKVQGGVRFDCAECHRYHNGDNPWQGLGATSRGAPSRGADDNGRDIDQFLNGPWLKRKTP